MEIRPDNETWLIEEGHSLIQKKAISGLGTLSAWERLVYCLWVADYGMRNGGDLSPAKDVYHEILAVARLAAEKLSLPLTFAAFSMTESEIEEVYFDRFNSICNEIRSAQSGQREN